MSSAQFSLLTKRRFAPLFTVQFLGAFNDNLLKFAVLFLANYGLYAAAPDKASLLGTIATGLFILPYFLFSALAGQMADAWDKARMARMVKGAEIGIMAIALAGFHLQSASLLLVCIFLLGVHSTLFGPIKYAILPQHLHEDEVMAGTGLIEAGTFLAILGGQLLAGVISPMNAALAAFALAVLGFVAAFAIPPAPGAVSGVKIETDIIGSTRRVLQASRRTRSVWLSILGISWFFAIGAVLLSQFAPLVTGVLHAREEVATLFLFIFSISVAFGSIFVNRLLKGEVSGRYVPVSAFLLAVFLIDLGIVTTGFHPMTTDAGIVAFIAWPVSWHILIDLAFIAFFGGMFVVPLYAVLQTHSAPEERSRIIAANNIVNAAVTVAVVVVVTLLLAGGASVPIVLCFIGISTLAVALISCWMLPQTVAKAVLRTVLRACYRVDLSGAEHLPDPGQRAVIVVNHVSFLDGLLLAAFLPGKPAFAVHTQFARAWWLKPLLQLFGAFPVDPTNPLSTRAMVKAVREGRTLVIFPEGRITVTGALMKVFDGPGMVADKADAPIIPVRIDGAQYTPFSHLRGKVRLRRFPRIRITILAPRRFTIDGTGLSARQRRTAAGRQLYKLMSRMMFDTSHADTTLFNALVDARIVHGSNALVLEDAKRQPLSYTRLIRGALVLGRALGNMGAAGEAIGVFMPNVSPVALTFFGLQTRGYVPAMLNHTAGVAGLRASCQAAKIKTIVSIRAFVDQAKLGSTVAALEADGVKILWLEDIVAQLRARDKVLGAATDLWKRFGYRTRTVSPDSPAVILFTSGSEGLPKGVVLTHRNILSNCRQLAARIDFNATDVVMNVLPVFHSFGLTGGMLFPLLHGVRTLLYPNPLHYRIIPALSYDANATILFGTDTFLSGYARMAHGYDFYSLRYIFSGAERVRDETRKVYAEKFGVRILEGYGATEASPVIAVNTPMHFRAGTVGVPLPGIEIRIDQVDGIAEGGRLSIRGPNVMAGYLKADAPGVLQPPPMGWHDTGDIVSLDDDGYMTIIGRAKRFAKIGGEMVSLPAVETAATGVWPDAHHAVVTRPDARKGEQLVLFTTQKIADHGALLAWARSHGMNELSVPRDIRVIETMPLLGTGKVDYVALSAMATA
jgi:acyl-[acyl-carrier-protein]-phospholipid O-acyltransferase/long-chain-fatty-acid--[acyl-carrier-protein] ligase